MRRLSTLFVILGTMAFAVPGSATAHGHHNNHSYGTNQRVWMGHGENPWSRPNCFLWSPKVRYWVWICGPPYPPDMPHT